MLEEITGTNSAPYQKLADDIRQSVESQDDVTTELSTSQRIIARVTDGIYREPWAAFRELIANAYDADASYVRIETGVPEFENVSVRDDGLGMSPETLAYVLKNIGGSSKRIQTGVSLNTVNPSENDKSPGGRLLIGKIGIGLFAIAQLTQHFQIITKSRGEDIRTSATFRLHTHDEKNFETMDQEYVAGQVTIKSEFVQDDEKNSQGTTIVLYTLRREVRRALQSFQRWEASFLDTESGENIRNVPKYHIGCQIESDEIQSEDLKPNYPWEPAEEPDSKFSSLFERVSENPSRGAMSANLEQFDEYLKLVWNLSLSLPLEYIEKHPFDISGSDDLIFFDIPSVGQASRIELSNNETLRMHVERSSEDELLFDHNDSQLSFSVVIDGIALKRPIRLSHKLLKKSRIRAPVMAIARVKNTFSDEQLVRAGGQLSFDAYLYWNSQIVPKETAGVLVRVRQASGTLFDRTFMNYQVSEQTRLRQITAEIFVHEGLDSAINIDRESFNYSHPHYLYIQKWLHKALRLLVNRLKSLASEDLNREKKVRLRAAKSTLYAKADEVWYRRYGEEADPPVSRPERTSSKLGEIGGVVVPWTPNDESKNVDEATALAIVLEAYGVLSDLSAKERSDLIIDILNIFKD